MILVEKKFNEFVGEDKSVPLDPHITVRSDKYPTLSQTFKLDGTSDPAAIQRRVEKTKALFEKKEKNLDSYAELDFA